MPSHVKDQAFLIVGNRVSAHIEKLLSVFGFSQVRLIFRAIDFKENRPASPTLVDSGRAGRTFHVAEECRTLAAIRTVAACNQFLASFLCW